MLLGINIHDDLGPNQPYADAADVLKAIHTLGARIVRGVHWDRPNALKLLADNGIGYAVMCPPRIEDVTVDALKPAVDIAKAKGLWIAIEGLNEPDGSKPTDGTHTDWISYVHAHQAAVAKVGKVLRVTVLGPSIGARAAEQVGRLPMDRVNVHSYGWPHTQVPDVALAVAECDALAPGRRPIVTECGVSTWSHPLTHAYVVSEDLQAQIIASAWDRAKGAGATCFFPYELVDQWRSFLDSTNYERNFGLFRSDWTPKPAVAELRAKAATR